MNWKQPPVLELGKPRKAKPKGGKAITKTRMDRTSKTQEQTGMKTRTKKVQKLFKGA